MGNLPQRVASDPLKLIAAFHNGQEINYRKLTDLSCEANLKAAFNLEKLNGSFLRYCRAQGRLRVRLLSEKCTARAGGASTALVSKLKS